MGLQISISVRSFPSFCKIRVMTACLLELDISSFSKDLFTQLINTVTFVDKIPAMFIKFNWDS